MTESLTNEQKTFLEECEREFADRYTENDSEFMKIKTAEPKKPPIVDPWHKARRPKYESPRQNQGRRSERHEERYDRHAGARHLYHHRNARPY